MSNRYLHLIVFLAALIGGVLIGQGILAHQDARLIYQAIQVRP